MDRFFMAAVKAWKAEPEGIEKLVSTNIRLHCENARLTEQLRIATDFLEYLVTQHGPNWALADDALTQMSVVE